LPGQHAGLAGRSPTVAQPPSPRRAWGSTPSSSASIDRILRTASSASPCRPDRTSASASNAHIDSRSGFDRTHSESSSRDGRFLTQRDSQQGQILDSDQPQTGQPGPFRQHRMVIPQLGKRFPSPAAQHPL